MDENRLSFKREKKQQSFPPLFFYALGILKGIVAVVSGSVALLAGTIDSFSDVFSSIAVWAGLKNRKEKTHREVSLWIL